MYRPRLDQLADGIFAIVMTFLVLEFRVPTLPAPVTNAALLEALKELAPVLLSYILSFLVLINYWTAHHYMMSVIAQNLTRTLTFLNIPFLMAIGLVPFAAHLLGTYSTTQVAVVAYGLNVIVIGFSLFLISHYVITSPEIKTNPEFSQRDFMVGYLRTFIPILAAVVAIIVSFKNPQISLLLFILSIMLNLIPGTLHLILRIFGFEKRGVAAGSTEPK